ncbi:hypothetical protein PMAYCL1PPCAC_17459, partial [Pristionchus mayeri]
ILVVVISLPPVIIFLSQISKIALHDNCKFLLRAWSSAFLVCLIVHCAYIVFDLLTGKFIPESNHDPPIRLLLFGFHGFAHTMSSAQELMLSMERAVSCASPEHYHNQSLAKIKLVVAESFSVGKTHLHLNSLVLDNVAIACCISNSIDFASLICLTATTYYVMKRKRLLLNSSLNEKYQIKEALDITRVMLPCGVISLVMKVSCTFAAWIYALDVFDSKYMFTITAGAYFIVSSLNCMICSTLILLKHEGLRRITERMLFPKRVARVRDQRSPDNVREIYFDALFKEWN